MAIVIVGAGLFGSMAAALCRKVGYEVTVIDNNSSWAASKCSSGLIRDSWLTSLSDNQIATGYRVLEKLYQVVPLQFRVQPKGNLVDLTWVDPTLVLKSPDVKETVLRIRGQKVEVETGTLYGDKILVAAGINCGQLTFTPPIKALVGASLRIRGHMKEPLMRVYAPYRQAMAFNISTKEVWVGDGTAILQKNWKQEARVATLLQRAYDFFDVDSGPGVALTGARPYVEGHKAGYFAKANKNVWVSTGGAKNGTLLAAYQAQLFLEAIS